MNQTNEKIAVRVSLVTIAGNVLLSAFKLFAGLFGKSSAMISDAVHSLSDVLSTIVVIIGAKMAAKRPDRNHPYGHERLECVSALLLAIMLGLTGVGIGYTAVSEIVDGSYRTAAMPSLLTVVAAVVSIVSKEAMYWYTRAAGKKIQSGALMADAWHHRSDALSSVGCLVGIVGARMGFLILDKVAGIVICLLVVKVAVDIFRDAISKLVDTACDCETVEEICAIIDEVEGIVAIDDLKTRRFGEKIYVDAEVSADGALSLEEAHALAQTVHDNVEANIKTVKHCMIHVNPCISVECDT